MSVGEWIIVTLIGGLLGGFLFGLAFAWATKVAGGIAIEKERYLEQPPQFSQTARHQSVRSTQGMPASVRAGRRTGELGLSSQHGIAVGDAVPPDLLYSDDDLWVEETRDSENVVWRVGVTDYAQASLGGIVKLELPEEGDRINAGRTFGVIRSDRHVLYLGSPITGRVHKRNEAVLAEPSLVNESPYADGWLLIVALLEPLPATLMSSTDYWSSRAL